MTAADFHAALAALGMTQRAFAERWNTPLRTIRHYLNGTRPIPGWVAVAVRYTQKHGPIGPITPGR